MAKRESSVMLAMAPTPVTGQKTDSLPHTVIKVHVVGNHVNIGMEHASLADDLF